MLIKVLGAAAGGGLPQWNCAGRNSVDARLGRDGLKPQTQASIAVSANERDWVIVNAAPELRQQINDNPELHPRSDAAARNSPIKAVLITNGDVDAVAGLLSLREGQPFNLYGSDRVLGILAQNSIFNVLDPAKVRRIPFVLDTPFEIEGPDGPAGIVVEAFTVPGKVPLYLEDETVGAAGGFGTKEGDTVGLRIADTDSGAHFFYVAACASLDERLAKRLRGAPLVFFDSTLFTDNEMIDQGLMPKTGTRMGHMNISGENGSIATFEPLGVGRRIFIHINNSNPVHRPGSDARVAVEAAGWEVAYDGMRVEV